MAELRREDRFWPGKKRVYLTLDYECDYGTALGKNTYHALSATSQLVELLERFEIPLTCFVQTEVLEQYPDEVERMRRSDSSVMFHPHSHTHAPREEACIKYEVSESTTRFEEFFGERPTGYRFPNGNIREADYRLLAEYGYEFDASVFPSWRPGHFNNTQAATRPEYFPDFDLVELPFTVYSPVIRIPTALSYCQLLGRPFSSLLTRRSPSTVILNIHMHDLVRPPSYDNLPLAYRLIYGRNRNGFDPLQSLISAFLRQGATFDTLDRAHEAIREGSPQ